MWQRPVLNSILKLLIKPLGPVNRILPKNKTSILIYSNLGFRDNTKSLYDHLVSLEYNERYKITVCCPEAAKLRKNAPDNVRFVGKARAFICFLRAGYMFYSFGKFPIKPAKKQTVVNLWHGMPLKSIGKLEKGKSFDGKCYFDYTIATSPFFGEIMEKCFCCRKDQVLLTGQPRCDKLFNNDRKRKKIILWFPTYRTSEKLGSTNSSFAGNYGIPLVETPEDLAMLENQLAQHGFKLVIKPHPMQDKLTSLPLMKHIAFATDKMLLRRGLDIYDIMSESSALITDYSSLSFDYLLLDRPIAYTADDLEAYDNQRGFSVADPKSLMAGEIITDLNGLTHFIHELAAGKDKYAQRRKEVNALVNSSQHGNACESILLECNIR